MPDNFHQIHNYHLEMHLVYHQQNHHIHYQIYKILDAKNKSYLYYFQDKNKSNGNLYVRLINVHNNGSRN